MLIAKIDLSQCDTIMDIHRTLQETLGFPSFYGKNLDALWDCLTGFMDSPADITFVNLGAVHACPQDYLEKILETFAEAATFYDDDSIHVTFLE